MAAMRNQIDDFIDSALRGPTAGLPYHVSRWLGALQPGKALREGRSSDFDIDGFRAAGRAHGAFRKGIHPQIVTRWRGSGKALRKETENAWFEVEWNDQRIEVLLMEWSTGDCTTSRQWILA